jgi:uncharacterized protein (DUF2345 family)
MQRFQGVPIILAAGLVLTAYGQGVAQTVVPPGTFRCAEKQDIAIEASKDSFKIAGACGKIVVKGAGNKLTVESAGSVDISGPDTRLEIDAVDNVTASSDGNTIVYKRGLTRPKASVVTLGDNNKIIQSAK